MQQGINKIYPGIKVFANSKGFVELPEVAWLFRGKKKLVLIFDWSNYLVVVIAELYCLLVLVCNGSYKRPCWLKDESIQSK